MALNFDDELFGPIHDDLAVDVVVTPITSAGAATVPMIEDTVGMDVEMAGGTIVSTVRPAATVRMAVLTAAGLTRSDMKGAALQMSGRTYRVESSEPRPTPNGDADGQLF